ncbi:MAG: serine/threonine protein kinase [Labilithrix sp.]|nr:serine/threonine protein kinase [Labilithrix sp.]MCW5811653.1 serine/threonine protein kinase [Labilithrix sp.]
MTTALEVTRGTVLRGKYRVERTLGEGGMGIVLLATHVKLEQRVALKMLRPAARARPNVVARFAREARAAAKLRNDHVVRVLDVDETEEGDPFLVMEYLSGTDLETRVRRDGPLSPAEAIDYALQACEGIAEAHALGIVHRDLKPANLFVTKSAEGTDRIKVLDFGIAKAGEDFSVTAADAILGSPSFMAPEQLASAGEASPRSDIWSLGVVLFYVLTGELPFVADNLAALAAKITGESARSLRDLHPTLPEPLYDVIDRCLEKDPADRFASVVELARALADAAEIPDRADRVSRIARAAAVRVEQPSSARIPLEKKPERVTEEVAITTAPVPRRRRWPLFALVAILVIGAVVVIRWRARKTEMVAEPAVTLDPAGVGFDDLSYAPSLKRVVIPAGELGEVALLDPESRKLDVISGFTRSPTGKGGHTQGATSAAMAGGLLAVIDRSTRTVALVAPEERRILSTHPLGGVPDYVRYEPTNGEVWVTEPDIERIEVFTLDAAAKELRPSSPIEVPGGPEFVAFDATRAFTNLWKGQTSTIDLHTHKVRNTFTNGCEGSRTLAIDERRALLFVACVEGRVTSIDLSHGYRLLGKVDYHPGIDALVLDPTRGLLYAPSAEAGKMAAIAFDRDGVPSLAFEVTTQKGAACATLDPSGAIWICDPVHGRLLVMAPPR